LLIASSLLIDNAFGAAVYVSKYQININDCLPGDLKNSAYGRYEILESTSFQAENCFNGIDDDGDGLVDVWDVFDCPCGVDQVINTCPTSCTYVLSPQPYVPELLWSGPSVDSREQVLVGDVDNDGLPEVIFDDYGDPGTIYVLDGATGNVEHTIATGLALDQNNSSNAIADTDGDGFAEIYVVASDPNAFLSRFDFDGTAWSLTYTNNVAMNCDEFIPAFADFDADGTPELYAGDMIFQVSDGSLIVEDPNYSANNAYVNNNPGLSVAADMLPPGACTDCAGLELVTAGRVYAVNIASGTMNLEVNLDNAEDGLDIGPTSVADVDGDGDLDVAYTTRVATGPNRAGLIVWDGQTDSLLMPHYRIPPGLGGDQQAAAGRVNIADFDNDGELEFGFNGREIYQVVDDINAAGAPVALWTLLNTDRSGRTGSTVFDFEADGAAEVVYRDEDTLYILNGATGAVLFSTFCTSGTRYEYPVVADVNNDGQTELCVTCNNIGVSLFRSANAPWAPSRAVWNQHSYNVTNVNDDLTIPSIFAPNATFLGGIFNNYLVQTSPITANGDIILRATDADITNASIDYTACPNITATLTLTNLGDAPIPSSLSITLYDGDPTSAGAVNLTTFTTDTVVVVGTSHDFDFPL